MTRAGGRATMIEQTLRERGDWLGASCVPQFRDRGLLFAGRISDGALVLTGIGGKVEPGETFREAVLREFAEEAGVVPRLLKPPMARSVGDGASEMSVPEGAALLCSLRASSADSRRLWIAVFMGTLEAAPRPIEKVRFFVVVPPRSAGEPWDARGPGGLEMVANDEIVPATEVLPDGITALRAELSAHAVLSTPGLFDEWSRTTEQPGG